MIKLPAPNALALLVLMAIGLLIFPIPAEAIDLLLSLQLALSVLLLLSVLNHSKPLELGALPSFLLLSTLFRLALNLSTTRLILGQGYAGRMVEAFGRTVIANDLLVGLVIFIILVLIQYLVIARGAERVAQVAARFALDAMPGQQLAIDSGLRSGLLDAEGARGKQAQLQRSAHLYGALDGAMKFVKGDAIAGLIIVAVNALGGLAVGLGRQGLSAEEAAQLFLSLTIGDGLLAQIPATLSALAAALLVTRMAQPEARSLTQALLSALEEKKPLWMTAALFAVLALLPGLPSFPLLLGAGLFSLAAHLWNPPNSKEQASKGPKLHLRLHPKAEAALLPSSAARVAEEARGFFMREHHLWLPPVQISLEEQGSLQPGAYRLEIQGVRVGEGFLPQGRRFVLGAVGELEARDPRLGLLGCWQREGVGLQSAEFLNAHLLSLWSHQGKQLLGIQTVADLLRPLEEQAPALMRAVIPRVLSLPQLAQLLRQLMAEYLPLRDLRLILEALAVKEPSQSALSAARLGLTAQLSQRLAPQDHLELIFPSTELEEQLRAGSLGPDSRDDLFDGIRELWAAHPTAALMVPPDLRLSFYQLLSTEFPGIPVVSAQEIYPGVQLTTLGILE